MEAVYVALIVAVPAVATTIATIITLLLTNRNLRKVKQEDWARQDIVAAKAAEVVRLLKQNNQVVAVATAETHKQLNVIHTLVNSTLTAALQGRLDANRKSVALMRRIIELNRAQSVEPNQEALAEIEASEKEVSGLAMEIADRAMQAKVVIAQQKE